MYAKLVREFSQACEDLDKVVPQKLDQKKIEFICNMVSDEIEELKEAETLTDQMDAFGDLIYYILDICNKAGIDLDPIFKTIHEANMKKVVKGKVIRREDGKILKPENWTSPEPLIEQIIEQQIQGRSS